MSISQERKAALISEFGKNEKDSGSASVQVAILSVIVPFLITSMNVKITKLLKQNQCAK